MSLTRVGGLVGPLVGGALLGRHIPVFGLALLFGAPMIAAALIMAALGVEKRGKVVEHI